MKMEIVKAEDYGIEETKANELTSGLQAIKAERDVLASEFEAASKLEVNHENIPKFKSIRLRIVKNRTQGINKWHKANKEFFLTGGKFVDAIKKKEIAINEFMESKLLEAENHFENLENARLDALQEERAAILLQYVPIAEQVNLAQMEDDVWDAYLTAKKSAYFKKKEEEEKEAARIKEEKEKAEAERKRILKENEELRKAAAEKEKQAAAERKILEDKLAAEAKERAKKEAEEKAKIKKLQDELEAKKKAESEAKIKAEAEALADKKRKELEIEAELSKGDEAKILDLVSDLEALKEKYSFDSKKNKEKYSSIGELLDKVIIYAKK